MSEEKKKDSFTFSDKIKNSKQTSSKSFANRISSKIGSDGKPRQTLFERTKRDAPFFIAALVALLLLPFLYKYSGQVAEEPAMITPGYEDAMVNPDRSGFDFTGDPEGQIAQLAGRDSLDLIVGFGKKGEDEGKDESLADIYRSGLDDSAASSYSRNATEEEVNNTNIYKYRNNAAPQTRAAIRRAATKINGLRREGVARGSGGHGISPWGGSMKSAASKVRGPAVRNSVKPVSLQPLQAAGKPSRSYFGGGPGAAARQSKEAMGKANAMQALMDAQFKPVDPGRIGGLNAGDYGGPGGGAGNLARNFTYNGKEPWWWDMMKRRSQMKWEAWFNYGWKWMNWATDLLQNQLAGIFNCLVMGNSDGDPDTFLGSGGGPTKETCCGKDASYFPPSEIEKEGGLKGFCSKMKQKELVEKPYSLDCSKGYVPGGAGSGSRLGPIAQRRQCLGGIGKLGVAVEASNCNNMVYKHYQVTPTGKARKWNKYVYVVARNYLPDNIELNDGTPRGLLCSADSDRLRFAADASTGLGNYQYSNKGEVEENKNEKGAYSKEYKAHNVSPSVMDVDQESEADACVIYLAASDTLDSSNFESAVLKRMRNLTGDDATALEAYNSLDLMFVKAFIAKDKIAYRTDEVDLPMMYKHFYNAYIRHKRTEGSAGSYQNERYWSDSYKQDDKKDNSKSSVKSKAEKADTKQDNAIAAANTAITTAQEGVTAKEKIVQEKEKALKEVEEQLEKIKAAGSSSEGYEEENIQPAKEELKKAQKELADAQKKLADAQKKLGNAQKVSKAQKNYNEGKGKDKKRLDVDKKPYRTEGEDYILGQTCYFNPHVSIRCEDAVDGEGGPSVAYVTFKGGYKGKGAEKNGMVAANKLEGDGTVTVDVTYTSHLMGAGSTAPTQHATLEEDGNPRKYSFTPKYFRVRGKTDSEIKEKEEAAKKSMSEFGSVNWHLYRNGKLVDTATCEWSRSWSNETVFPNSEEPMCTEDEVLVVNSQCKYIKPCDKETGKFGEWSKVGTCECDDTNPSYTRVDPKKTGPIPGTDTDPSITCDNGSKIQVFPYPHIKNIPVNIKDNSLVQDPEEQKASVLTKRYRDNSNRFNGSCKIDVDDKPLVAMDNDTKAYLQRAQKKYNDQSEDSILTGLTAEYEPTIANLVEAIYINPDNGTVPANTVCLLGKSIGMASQDPQRGEDRSYGTRPYKHDGKTYDLVGGDNMFGTFLAFITYEAAHRPSLFTKTKTSSKEMDGRFDASLSQGLYHWGSYSRGGSPVSVYKDQIDKGPWAGLPLRALARPLKDAPGTSADEKKREGFKQTYEDMLEPKAPCHCEKYGQTTVPYNQVIEYVKRLCDHGLAIKPHADKDYYQTQKSQGANSGSHVTSQYNAG